jgi:hypothetical protein
MDRTTKRIRLGIETPTRKRTTVQLESIRKMVNDHPMQTTLTMKRMRKSRTISTTCPLHITPVPVFKKSFQSIASDIPVFNWTGPQIRSLEVIIPLTAAIVVAKDYQDDIDIPQRVSRDLHRCLFVHILVSRKCPTSAILERLRSLRCMFQVYRRYRMCQWPVRLTISIPW